MDVYFAITIAVFSILVTALITWQIYSYILVDKKVKQIINDELEKVNCTIEKQFKLHEELSDKSVRLSTISLCNIVLKSAFAKNDFQTVLSVYVVMLEDINEYYKEVNAKILVEGINGFINICVETDTNLDVLELNKLKQGLQQLSTKYIPTFDVLINLDRLHLFSVPDISHP